MTPISKGLPILTLALLAGTAGWTASAEETARVVLGIQPIAPAIPAFLAQQQGFFAEEGLDVEFRPEPGGQDITTAVVADEYDFGFSNVGSLLIAYSRGLDVRAIANGTIGESDETSAVNGIMVKEDSPYHSWTDLVGRTVSINTLDNAPFMTMLYSAEQAGVENPLNAITWVEVEFPDVVGVISRDQIDAGWAVEPFKTIGEQNGLRSISNPLYDTEPGYMLSAYFTSSSMVEENPEVVAAFARAINRAMELASADPDLVRESFPQFNTNVTPEIASAMDISKWSSEFSAQMFEKTAEMALRYGMIEEIPDLDALIYISDVP